MKTECNEMISSGSANGESIRNTGTLGKYRWAEGVVINAPAFRIVRACLVNIKDLRDKPKNSSQRKLLYE